MPKAYSPNDEKYSASSSDEELNEDEITAVKTEDDIIFNFFKGISLDEFKRKLSDSLNKETIEEDILKKIHQNNNLEPLEDKDKLELKNNTLCIEKFKQKLSDTSWYNQWLEKATIEPWSSPNPTGLINTLNPVTKVNWLDYIPDNVEFFVEPKKAIQEVNNFLNNQSLERMAINGNAGSGKSELIKFIAKKYFNELEAEKKFPIVWLINCKLSGHVSVQEEIVSSYQQLASLLYGQVINKPAELDINDWELILIKKVNEKLVCAKNFLLIFDNITEYTYIKKYIDFKKVTEGKVVFLTKIDNFLPNHTGNKNYQVEIIFGINEHNKVDNDISYAVKFFFEMLNKVSNVNQQESNDVKDLLRKVEVTPLTLHALTLVFAMKMKALAGYNLKTLIKEINIDPKTNKSIDLFARSISGDGRLTKEEVIKFVIHHCLTVAEHKKNKLKDMLIIGSLMAPNEIPADLLESIMGLDHKGLQTAIADTCYLLNLNIVGSDNNTYYMHNITQQVIKNYFKDEIKINAKKIINSIIHLIPNDSDLVSSNDINGIKKIFPHIRMLYDNLNEFFDESDKVIVELRYKLSVCMRMQGDIKGSINFTPIGFLDFTDTSMHYDKVHNINELKIMIAFSYVRALSYVENDECYKKILDVCGNVEKIFETNLDKYKKNYMLPEFYNMRARAFQMQGEFSKAVEECNKSIKIYRELKIDEKTTKTPQVAYTYYQLGRAQVEQLPKDKVNSQKRVVKLHSILEFYELSKNIHKRIGKLNSYSAALVFIAIGRVFVKLDKFDKGLKKFKKARNILEKMLGVSHPVVAIALNNMSIAFRKLGKANKGIKYSKLALEIRLNALTENNARTAMAYKHLGLAQALAGENEPAINNLTKAQALLTNAKLNKHPWMEKIKKNLNNIKFRNAILTKNITEIERLIREGIDIYKPNEHQRTFLHILCAAGTVKTLKKILNAVGDKLNFDEKDNNNLTPLMVAVDAANIPVVKYLLGLGREDIKINATSKGGYTALHYCCYMGYMELAGILLSNPKIELTIRTNSGYTPLNCAENYGHRIIADAIKLKLTKVDSSKDRIHNKWSLYLNDFMLGKFNLVFNNGSVKKEFLEKNSNGYNFLHYILSKPYNNNFEQLALNLISSKKISIKDTAGKNENLLHFSALNNYSKVVDKLINEEADLILKPDSNGLTSLHKAIQGNHLDILRSLLNALKERKRVQKSSNDWSPLHMAAALGNLEATKLILSDSLSEAWISLTSEGWLPLHEAVCAVSSDRNEIVKLLLDKKSELINAQDRTGDTALHLVVKKRFYDTFKLLINHDAQILANNDGVTPLTYAKYLNLYPIIEIIDKKNKKPSPKSAASMQALSPKLRLIFREKKSHKQGLFNVDKLALNFPELSSILNYNQPIFDVKNQPYIINNPLPEDLLRGETGAEIFSYLEKSSAIVVHGESGVGKTLYLHSLVYKAWSFNFIPIFINIEKNKIININNQELMLENNFFNNDFLDKLFGVIFPDMKLDNLKSNANILIIIDNFEDVGVKVDKIKFNSTMNGFKNVKLVLSCKTYYLKHNRKNKIFRRNTNFLNLKLWDFNDEQIESYLKISTVDQKECLLWLKKLDNTLNFFRNPHVLSLMLNVYKNKDKPHVDTLISHPVSKAYIYKSVLGNLHNVNENRHALSLLEEISFYLFVHKDAGNKWENNKDKIFENFQYILNANKTDSLSFTHASWVNYFTAFYVAKNPYSLCDVKMDNRSLPELYDFLSDIVINNMLDLNNDFVNLLINIINETKYTEDNNLKIAGSHAFNLLNRVKANLILKDFSGVQVPYANLNNTVLDGVKFIDSDLGKQGFAYAFLRNVSMDKAKISSEDKQQDSEKFLIDKFDSFVYFNSNVCVCTVGSEVVFLKIENNNLIHMHTLSSMAYQISAIDVWDEFFIYADKNKKLNFEYFIGSSRKFSASLNSDIVHIVIIDTDKFAVATKYGGIEIFVLESGVLKFQKELQKPKKDAHIISLKYDRLNKLLIAGFDNRKIKLFYDKKLTLLTDSFITDINIYLKTGSGHNGESHSYLAINTLNNLLTIFDLKKKKYVRTISMDANSPKRFASFNKVGYFLFYGNTSQVLFLDINSGEIKKILSPSTEPIIFADFINTKHIVTLHADGSIVFSYFTIDENISLPHTDAIYGLTTFKYNEVLYTVTGGKDGNVNVWNLDKLIHVKKLSSHKYPIYSIAFDPNENRLAYSSSNARIYIWDVANWGLIKSLKVCGRIDKDSKASELIYQNETAKIGFSSDGEWLISADMQGQVFIYDLKSDNQEEFIIFQRDFPIFTFDFCKDTNVLYAAGIGQKIVSSGIDANVPEHYIQTTQASIYHLKILSEKKLLYASNLGLFYYDGVVEKKLIGDFPVYKFDIFITERRKIYDLAVVNDNKVFLYTIDNDFNLSDKIILEGHLSTVCNIKFVNQEKLITVDDDHIINLWVKIDMLWYCRWRSPGQTATFNCQNLPKNLGLVESKPKDFFVTMTDREISNKPVNNIGFSPGYIVVYENNNTINLDKYYNEKFSSLIAQLGKDYVKEIKRKFKVFDNIYEAENEANLLVSNFYKLKSMSNEMLLHYVQKGKLYILCVWYDKETLYKLALSGNFNVGVRYALDYYDVLSNKIYNDRPIVKYFNKNFQGDIYAVLDKLYSSASLITASIKSDKEGEVLFGNSIIIPYAFLKIIKFEFNIDKIIEDNSIIFRVNIDGVDFIYIPKGKNKNKYHQKSKGLFNQFMQMAGFFSDDSGLKLLETAIEKTPIVDAFSALESIIGTVGIGTYSKFIVFKIIANIINKDDFVGNNFISKYNNIFIGYLNYLEEENRYSDLYGFLQSFDFVSRIVTGSSGNDLFDVDKHFDKDSDEKNLVDFIEEIILKHKSELIGYLNGVDNSRMKFLLKLIKALFLSGKELDASKLVTMLYMCVMVDNINDKDKWLFELGLELMRIYRKTGHSKLALNLEAHMQKHINSCNLSSTFSYVRYLDMVGSTYLYHSNSSKADRMQAIITHIKSIKIFKEKFLWDYPNDFCYFSAHLANAYMVYGLYLKDEKPEEYKIFINKAKNVHAKLENFCLQYANNMNLYVLSSVGSYAYLLYLNEEYELSIYKYEEVIKGLDANNIKNHYYMEARLNSLCSKVFLIVSQNSIHELNIILDDNIKDLYTCFTVVDNPASNTLKELLANYDSTYAVPEKIKFLFMFTKHCYEITSGANHPYCQITLNQLKKITNMLENYESKPALNM